MRAKSTVRSRKRVKCSAKTASGALALQTHGALALGVRACFTINLGFFPAVDI